MQQDSQFLIDMLHLAQRIVDCTASSSLNDFYEDVKLQDDTLRRLLKIGKTARRISPETRQQMIAINWCAMDEMKSRLMQMIMRLMIDRVWRSPILKYLR
ncbi:MAG: hypothetical protein HC800_23180 [Phormidesmis sp. RL_2_1]|nr:hypothetical protein [Phormidesmis sp. RL_2_1]